MKTERQRDKEKLNSIFLEMGMDKDVASLISGIRKKDEKRREREKSVDKDKRR